MRRDPPEYLTFRLYSVTHLPPSPETGSELHQPECVGLEVHLAVTVVLIEETGRIGRGPGPESHQNPPARLDPETGQLPGGIRFEATVEQSNIGCDLDVAEYERIGPILQGSGPHMATPEELLKALLVHVGVS